jgi:outer membrane protein TolC
MKIFFLCLGVMSITALAATELFTKDEISNYLTEENPFVYAAVGNKYIYREKEKYYLGDFDTKLSAAYDKKEYPVSDGEFFDVSLQKPLENGVEFIAGYRNAQGTQEYNNIKTSEDGEIRAGIKVPVFSVMHDISTRKLNLNLAALDTMKFSSNAKDNLRLLYFKIISDYNKLLYSKAVLELERELLLTAQKREDIIKQKVKVGALADITLLEASQQTINRKQRLVSEENDFSNMFEGFLQYLNLSREAFEKHYTLPKMKIIQKGAEKSWNIQSSIDAAMQNRPDLKIFDYEVKKMNVQKQHSQLLNYPNFNLSLYGVHDLQYDNGFKVALDMDFPIERRKYEGKQAEIRQSIKNIENNKEKEIITLKTNLSNIINSMESLATNIENSKDEIVLVEKLEEVENKKYILGLSDLFMVNQRELYTLEVKKKLLKYNLEYLLLEQEANKEIG